MELYTLNSNFLYDQIIEDFQSVIWTERYNAAGDVTLVAPATSKNRASIVENAFLSTPDSQEVMLIHTVSEEDDVIKALGESLVSFLSQRILRDTWQTTKDTWQITGAPGAVAGLIVQNMCCSGSGNIMVGTGVLPSPNGSLESIPNLTIGSLAGGTSVTVAVPYGNVYDGVKKVCDLDDVGFKLIPSGVSQSGYTLQFITYKGRDRTTGQTTNPPVVFDPAMDTLTDIKQVRSVAGYKTAAYAWAKGMTAQNQIGIAYAPGKQYVTGFSRRTLMVDATDINASDYTAAELTSILNQRAKDALANNNYARLMDGQVVPQNAYTYGLDFFLGDIVELRGDDFASQKARITEYIRAQDSTGTRAYPTLSVI